jgi:hypothetical protein
MSVCVQRIKTCQYFECGNCTYDSGCARRAADFKFKGDICVPKPGETSTGNQCGKCIFHKGICWRC